MRQACRNEHKAREGGVTGSACVLFFRRYATTAAPSSTVTGHTEGVFGIGDLGFMRVCWFGGGQNRKRQ